MSRFIIEFDRKGKVLSVLLSALTLFAILWILVPGWYEKLPVYEELVCGLTIWNGYHKQADLWLVYSVILGWPVLFLLWSGIYVALKLFWEKRKESPEEKTQERKLPKWLSRIPEEQLPLAMILMLACVAGFLFLSYFKVSVCNIWGKIPYLPPVVAVAVLVFCALVKLFREKRRLLWCLQFVLPLGWLGFVHFRYWYEPESAWMELFYSGRWKWACLGICLFCFLLCLWENKRHRNEIWLSTFIMAGVMRVFVRPEGVLNMDFFHNGEISMPMQQWLSYGKLPYRDLIPIHGMCDYYYGFINALFFDGSYLSLNAAKVAGNLLITVFLSVILYYLVENKVQGFLVVYLFMPFMVKTAGMRYWFFFLLLFFVFSSKIQKGAQSLYAWTFLSILAIGWNASIGGAGALGLLPVILYRCGRDLNGQWKAFTGFDKKKKAMVLTAWGCLFVVGLSFVPMFLRILSYLRENTGTTLYVNGMAMFSDTPFSVVEAFAFVLPLVITLAMMLGREKTNSWQFFVAYLSVYLVIVNYAFVRYDEGYRARVLGVFFLMITAVMLLYKQAKKGDVIVYLVFMVLAIWLSEDSLFVTPDGMFLNDTVPAYVETEIRGHEVDDPVVYVSGDSVEIPTLGTGFVQGNTLAGIKNVHALIKACNTKGKSIFDITNGVAQGVIYDMPVYLPYSSAYNISNERMQTAAIKQMEEKLPDVILAAPEIRFDEAPFSYRSRKLYRFLLEQDYVPYKYENVIYLARGENPLPEGKEDLEAFAQLMHKKYLGYLPAVYGASMENPEVRQELEMIPVETTVEETDSGFRVKFSRPLKGSEIEMLSMENLIFESKGESGMIMRVNSNIASEGSAEFYFILDGNNYLLPIGCSPYISEDEISFIEFELENACIKEDFPEIRFYE